MLFSCLYKYVVTISIPTSMSELQRLISAARQAQLGQSRVTVSRTYTRFREADNFCQGKERTHFGRRFTSILSNPYACPKKPDSKR